MNNLKNKVNLIGRLGVKPEIMTFDTGRKLARFSLATNDRYKDKNGEWQEDVQWQNVTVSGKVADRVEKLLEKIINLWTKESIKQIDGHSNDAHRLYEYSHRNEQFIFDNS